MGWIVDLLLKVQTWVKDHKAFPLFALVLFSLLIGLVGKQAGLTTDDIVLTVISILLLAVGAWAITNFSASPKLKLFASWALVVLLVVLACVVTYTISMRLVYPGVPPRQPYGEQFIPLRTGTPATMLTPANLAVGASDEDKQLAAQNKVWEWTRDGLEWDPPGADGKPAHDNTSAVVVCRSKTPFKGRLRPIHGMIDLNNELKIEEGVIFLSSLIDGRMTYRQMSFKPDITSDDNGASFTLLDPDPSDEVLIILRVRTKDHTELKGNPKSYGITMRVTEQ